MTDRELLELAAKAAGIEGYYCSRSNCLGGMTITGIQSKEDTWGLWNPLTDDGDALRLAVKLELDILNSCISVRAIHRDKDMGASIRCRGNAPQMDPHAATRRAIVRAAAEIGKGMK